MLRNLRLYFMTIGLPKWLFASISIIIMFTATGWILLTFSQKIIIDHIIPSGNGNTLAAIAVVILIYFSLLSGSLFLQDIFLTFLKQKVNYYILNRFLEAYLRIEFRSIQNFPVGDLVSRVSTVMTPVQDFLATFIFFTFFSLYSMIVISVIQFLYNPFLFYVTLAILPLQFYAGLYFGKKNKRLADKANKTFAETSSLYQNSFNGILDIKTNRLQRFFGSRGASHLRALNGIGFARAQVNQSQKLTHELITVIHTVAIIFIISRDIVNGTSTPGTLFFFLSTIGLITQPINRLNALTDQFQSSISALERLRKITTLPVEKQSTTQPLNTLYNKLVIKDLSFRYETGKEVFSSFSQTFTQGKLYCLAGPSGCGKSTLLKVIAGLYTPEKGSITISDAGSKNTLSPALIDEYRRHIGYCSQKNQIFSGSIKENILLGDSHLEKNLIAVAELTEIDSFINTLDNGYDTLISPSDTKLSGGQAQRIALARILIRNPQILLLDEVTSSLDPVVEEQVIMNLKRDYIKNRICIIITHRPETLRMSDTIITMKEHR